MRRDFAAACALALLAGAALAQRVPEDPDWKELETPPPPVLRTTSLIPLEIPGSALRWGVDPASVTLGADSIVRYVVVATGPSGAVNAMYEGIRCNSGDVKVYARHNPGTGWSPVGNAEWKPLHQGTARHSLLVARTGACVGRGPNRSAEQIVRDLASPVDTRFVR